MPVRSALIFAIVVDEKVWSALVIILADIRIVAIALAATLFRSRECRVVVLLRCLADEPGLPRRLRIPLPLISLPSPIDLIPDFIPVLG